MVVSQPGFFGRLFSTLVYYLTQGLGIGQAEERFTQTYGQIDEGAMEQAAAQAQESVANVERLLSLPPGAPLSAALGGNPEPNPTVWVRTIMRFTDRTGQVIFRTVDIEAEWSLSAAWVYAEAANTARDIADAYNWTLADIEVVPPLLF